MKENVYEISLTKFLARYLFLTGEDLKRLTHDDVKILFPNLKRCTFERIKEDPKLLESREVLLVSDSHKIIPYYVPKTKEYDYDYASVNASGVIDDRTVIQKEYDFFTMTNYELKTLLENKLNTRKNRMRAKRELEDRGIILKKKYKRVKEDFNKEDYYGEY